MFINLTRCIKGCNKKIIIEIKMLVASEVRQREEENKKNLRSEVTEITSVAECLGSNTVMKEKEVR